MCVCVAWLVLSADVCLCFVAIVLSVYCMLFVVVCCMMVVIVFAVCFFLDFLVVDSPFGCLRVRLLVCVVAWC